MKKYTELTLEEKIGQLLVVGFHGYEINEQVIELVKKYKVGNFILFARNIKDKEQLVELTSSLHKLVMEEIGVMPFICIDQEGGMVTRVMDERTTYPGQMTLGATNPKNAKVVGSLMGKHLLSLGINFNLAPDVDVNNNPLNPVIGVRSYGDDPLSVAMFANDAISGMQSEGLIACAKHFPGHGDVSVDSHLGLPSVSFDKERLEQIELYPFKEAIKNGVKSIMSAHIIFSEYDKTTPATLSKSILTGLLRHKLHFKGIIISDDMEMKAIDDEYTASVGAAAGIIAGLDLACCCHTFEKQVDATRMIMKSLKDNLITEEEIDKKLARIFKEKEETYKVLKKAFFEVEDKVKAFNAIKNTKSQEIVDKSLTRVSGEKFRHIGKGLVIYSNPAPSTIAEDKLNISSLGDLIKEKTKDYDAIEFSVNEYNSDIVNKALDYDTVVFISFNANTNENQARMINDINKKHHNFTVLSIRNPYDFYALEGNVNFITMYEATTLSNNTIIKFLNEELEEEGHLPVSLARHFNVGASVYIDHPEYSLKDNIEYLKMCKSTGIDTIFISASHVGDNPKYLENLKKIVEEAKKINIKLVMDINKSVMTKYKLPLDVYALRIDYGYSAEEMAEFIKNGHNIELNASAMELETINRLIELGVDLSKIRISHNFYPKPYTGLSQDVIREKNNFFKQFGLKILAFIPSSNMHRGPVFEGLCTIEDHRHMNLKAILSEMALLGVDDVCFGDAYASYEEISIVKNFDKDLLMLPMELTGKINDTQREFLVCPHINRYDQSEYIYRTEDRLAKSVSPASIKERHIKDVCLDNSSFAIYNGEISLVRKELEKDDRVNVVGHLLVSDWLFNGIKPGCKFKLEIIDKKDK